MGFLMYPGRTLSPACISDVASKNKAPTVPEASQTEFDQFIAKRLARHQQSIVHDDRGPLSTYLIHQELGWALGEQGSLLESERRRLEFKREMPRNDNTLSRCIITAAAMANSAGGYLIFGIDDKTENAVGIQESAWKNFDWDKFSGLITKIFQPSIDWRKRLIPFEGVQLGVLYVYQIRMSPVISTADWHNVKAATIYYRQQRASDRINFGDLLELLARRDIQINRRKKSNPL